MGAVMEDSGVAEVFAVLRARAMALSESDRDAFLATLAVEEAGMREAYATRTDLDLWSASARRHDPAVELDVPPSGDVADLLSAPRPRSQSARSWVGSSL